jgi:hypothetical protein
MKDKFQIVFAAALLSAAVVPAFGADLPLTKTAPV